MNIDITQLNERLTTLEAKCVGPADEIETLKANLAAAKDRSEYVNRKADGIIASIEHQFDVEF